VDGVNAIERIWRGKENFASGVSFLSMIYDLQFMIGESWKF
jgi:hypothetical protein